MSNDVRLCKVKIYGDTVGHLYLPENSLYVNFEYDDRFVKKGIEISPLVMPLSKRIFSFPNLNYETFSGLPGVFSDSLPDTFGNKMINEYLISIGRTENSFNPIEKLCYQGKRCMGALEYEPETNSIKNYNELIDITKLADFADEVLNNKIEKKVKEKDASYTNLLTLGTSAGGARAKALVAYNKNKNIFKSGQIELDEEYDYYIIKFDGIRNNGDSGLNDKPEYTKVEYAYFLMARDSGIEMSDCELFEKDRLTHFMTKRFDRYFNDNGIYKKKHMVTFGGIKHFDYKIPQCASYEQLSHTMRQLNKSEYYQEQIYRRMVFNVLAYNFDDHVKNFSFLMDENCKWELSPQYDLTFSYNKNSKWLSRHQMTINNKAYDINENDLITVGEYMDLKISKCKKIISDIKKIVSNFSNYAKESGASENTIKFINDIINDM